MTVPYLDKIRTHGDIYGRKKELSHLKVDMEQLSAGVELLVGPSGIGKSAILKFLKKESQRKGMGVVYVKVEIGEAEGDIADKVLRQLTSGKEKKYSGIKTLVRAIAGHGPHEPLAILIDDMEKSKNAPAIISSLLRIAGQNKGRVIFVISSTLHYDEIENQMVLANLNKHDIEELIEKDLRERNLKMGEECFNAIVNDSSANPRIVNIMCGQLYETLAENEQMISKAHYLEQLDEIMNNLESEWFGQLYAQSSESERKILKALAEFAETARYAEPDAQRISEISKKTRMGQGPLMALVRRLLESGQVVKLGRGEYGLFAKIYGQYILQRRT
ncbi:ATP-binding protein [Candidatus Micrarchaeota archaeon]|nr:ATP-binding protein [Candidatus Micrarchaeota archaeon]